MLLRLTVWNEVLPSWKLSLMTFGDVFVLLFATNQPFRDVVAAVGGSLWGVLTRAPGGVPVCPSAAMMRVTIPAAQHHLFAGVAVSGGLPAVSDYVIAARCPRCGGPRGAPHLEVVTDEDSGHFFCVDVWCNPCGHVDQYVDVMLEALVLGDGGWLFA